MIDQVLLFALGVVLLVAGAWLMVGGGKRLAAIMGVPTVVVGLTVVAFGTSAPELFVSLVGALRGSTGLVLGNVIGSNAANLGLILAVAALLRPVSVERGLVRRELPLLLVVTVVFGAMAWDGNVTRWEAGILCVGFVGFIFWTVRHGGRAASPMVPETGDMPPVVPGHKVRGALLGIAAVLGGIAGLVGGGKLIVDSALEVAQALGVSETVIGLTLVAVGTSLPELATTIMAAIRREDDLALGNIVGSNLFNILAVAGPVGVIRPLVDTDGAIQMQLITMGLITLLAFGLARLGGGGLGRGRGVVLLAAYVLVMVIWTLPN